MRGIGVDICEVARFNELKEKPDFLKRVFTDNEIASCFKRLTSSQCFAARFASKEAFLKALGTGLAKGVHFNEIEVVNDLSGKPYFNLYGETKDTLKNLSLDNVYLSISHEKQNAIAFVVIV